MEQSSAVKCPSISYHLAGTKKIQQELAKPNVLERALWKRHLCLFAGSRMILRAGCCVTNKIGLVASELASGFCLLPHIYSLHLQSQSFHLGNN
ncbi:uncharacterized protein LOC114277849 isoform X2 [Camellia sinensis]|uniref:uncharacterized protein LOC114277849 isoform X2 n=1 Tax=Camellia sinensis TaxID=4442 RepID=UPI0010365007|nr:uncharacterized protein LOC114277849 isoform X2 [Camellia sinensis]